MTTRRCALGIATTIAALVVIAPKLASATEETLNLRRPSEPWKLEAGAGYATSGAFDGLAVGVRAGWSPTRYLVLGLTLETASLQAEGGTRTGLSFSQSFQSTFAGGFVRAQLPIGLFTPYAEAALGYVGVHGRTSNNSQCSYDSGLGMAAAFGGDVQIARSLAVGVRAAIRNAGWTLTCGAAGGPWDFQLEWMKSLGATVAYRW